MPVPGASSGPASLLLGHFQAAVVSAQPALHAASCTHGEVTPLCVDESSSVRSQVF